MILGAIVNVPVDAAYEIWSLKSIFCSVVGIIWLIICLMPFAKGFWHGTLQNGIYFFVGLLIFWSLPNEWMAKHLYAYTTDTNGFYEVNIDPSRSISKYDYDMASYDGPNDYYYEYKIYAMNDSNSEDYVCPSWFFHPGCLTTTPLLLHLPAIALVAFIKKTANDFVE